MRLLARTLLFVLLGVQAARTQPAVEAPRDSLAAAMALQDVLVDVIASSETSVVAIARGQGPTANLQDPQFVPYEYATGVVVDRDGLILTNYHTLGDPARNAYVVWAAGKAFTDVRVKAADPWTDLAILETNAKDLVPITLGDAADLKKGQIVIALGNPHAIARDGNVSASWGILANLGRKVDGPLPGGSGTVLMQDRETRYHYGALLQTDVRLARGSSGGPLLDLKGNMIGLTTTIAALAGLEKGAGFAIPVDAAFRRALDKLKQGEEVELGFLGVLPRNLPRDRDGQPAVLLESVERGTPAYQAGLRNNDRITRIDEQAIRDIDDLFLHIGSLPPDHVSRVTFRRGGRELTLPVRLTKKPPNFSRPVIATAAPRWWRGMEVDYSTSKSLRATAPVDPQGCVVVKDVRRDSPAWTAGMRPGAMISHVDGRRVSRPIDFYRLVEQATAAVELTTFRLDGRDTILIPAATETP